MTSAVQKRRKPASMSSCAWCGERKPIEAMRHPASSRGKTPSTCHACRVAHPDESWCDHHGRPHPKSQFPVRSDRPIGLDNRCREAVSYLAAMRRGKPNRVCPSCDVEQESWYFRGGNNKSPVCRGCEQDRPGKRWCLGCETWLDEARFYRTGVGGKFWTVRCKPCGTAHDHGVTQAHLAKLTGGASPSCGACGSTDSLKIDHDHGHCPSLKGCPQCVRGFLCHQCNTAEGLLRTADRARLLAAYMDRWGL